MSELNVIPIPILPMGMINAHLIAGGNKHILVDSGIPNSQERIGKALNKHGLTFKDIGLIVVTHAHGDHAGSASAVQKLSGAPILAHQTELPYFQQEKPMTYCPTGLFGKFFLKTGRPTRPYDAFTPEILLKDKEDFNLSDFGVHGTVVLTSGHTEGSLSVTLSNRDALVSDLVASGILLGGIAMRGRPKPPPFEDDARMVAEELKRLIDMGMETFYLGHGGPLNAQQVRGYCERILQTP
jgi:glyoxylase-like metal-dependent hydrolase (beta-lactamase superfamily II)